ncbi:sulfatase [Pedobacter frigiditerrae]|uniref:sulfatase n=1 Tax=Pedobacter frigiditerrae TaxID=2530452 RepID=UPI00292E1086|nr:sulfatase [Pedobacter frigiditerrae]
MTDFKFIQKLSLLLLRGSSVACMVLLTIPVLAQKKTNVLFIVVDDLRPALGSYDDKNASSPNIDQLAANGTLFTNAYCQQAVCAPSRASFMTGKKPDHTQVWNLETHFRKALPNVVTLPQYFKNNGYYTRQIGKIYHDPKVAQDPLSWSVPELLAVTTNKGKYALESNLAKAPKSTATEWADVADSAYIDGMVADAAIKELNQVGNKPFFLAVGFRRPHLPFTAPLSYWKKNQNRIFPLSPDTAKATKVPDFSKHNSVELRGYTDIPDLGPIDEKKSAELIKGYYTSVTFMDEQVGKVLNELKRLNLDKNTIVVLLSDHGFHLGEHGLWGKTTNSKLDTRVPLIIADPEKLAVGKKSSSVVQLVDLYATLSELCGLQKPDTDGQSFAKIIKGKPFTGSGVAFSQFPNQMAYTNRPAIMGYTMHTANFSYTEWIELQTNKVLARELYDYRTDQAENHNVVADAKYKKQIIGFSKQISTYRLN